jgi:hypothetical protein
MLEILNGLLIKIGYEDNQTDDDLTRSLRQEAAKWTCILGEPQCKKMANIKLEEHLKASSKKHKCVHNTRNRHFVDLFVLCSVDSGSNLLLIY